MNTTEATIWTWTMTDDWEEKYIDENILNPTWSDGGRVHNWKNYVSEKIQKMWDTFSRDQKVALYEQADEQSGQENWD